MRRYLPYIVIGILLIASVYQWAENDGLVANIATEKQKVKDAETRISEKQLTIDGLEIENTKMSDSITILNSEIRLSKEKIRLIQKQKDEKVRIVDHLTLSELQEYFAKRYAAKTRSQTE